jgi:hypothetical protein
VLQLDITHVLVHSLEGSDAGAVEPGAFGSQARAGKARRW